MESKTLTALRRRLQPMEPKIAVRRLRDGRWCAEATYKGKIVRAFGLIRHDALRNLRALLGGSQ